MLRTTLAQEAYLYTYDILPRYTCFTSRVVTSVIAHAMWAIQLGQSDPQGLNTVERTILEEYDLFRKRQQLMFAPAQTKAHPLQLSIVIEGYDEGEYLNITSTER